MWESEGGDDGVGEEGLEGLDDGLVEDEIGVGVDGVVEDRVCVWLFVRWLARAQCW